MFREGKYTFSGYTKADIDTFFFPGVRDSLRPLFYAIVRHNIPAGHSYKKHQNLEYPSFKLSNKAIILKSPDIFQLYLIPCVSFISVACGTGIDENLLLLCRGTASNF